MGAAESIEKLLKKFYVAKKSSTATSAEMDTKVLDDALQALDKSKKVQSAATVPNIWRIIMKSRMTKLAAAAAIILIVVLSITILDKSTRPVWAIEQSIEAMDQYKAVIIEGSQSERTWIENGSLEVRPFKSWAVANEDQTMIEKYRTEVVGFLTLTTNSRKTWRYNPNTNTVRIENHPYVASAVWWGSKFLEQLKEARDKWVLTKWKITYDKDPSTGKERVFLTFSMPEGPPSPRSLWIEFDMESKLLVGLKQWENPDWQGPPDLVVDTITYFKTLPADLFEFEIPDEATVIE